MPMRLHTPLPSLEGITQWLNEAPNMGEVEGQPLLVYFWAVSCHICHDNMPKMQIWREDYVPRGLKMIAIHSPRMKTDTDLDKVESACEEFGIKEPCGVDNMHTAKKAFDNELWPAYFLFDREGELKCRAAGKAGLAMLEPKIEELLN